MEENTMAFIKSIYDAIKAVVIASDSDTANDFAIIDLILGYLKF